jgi:hypothetical protein
LVGGVARDAEYIARHIAAGASTSSARSFEESSGRISAAWKAVPS